MTEAKTRCIECGGFVGSLNEDEDGVPCAACAERLLETLPGVFHQPWSEAAGGEGVLESEDAYAEGATHGDLVGDDGGESGGDSRFGQ